MSNIVKNNSGGLIPEQSERPEQQKYVVPGLETSEADTEFRAGQALASLLKGGVSAIAGLPGDILSLGDRLDDAITRRVGGEEAVEERKKFREKLGSPFPTSEQISEGLGGKSKNYYNRIAEEFGSNLGPEILAIALTGSPGVGTFARRAITRAIPKAIAHTGVEAGADYANLSPAQKTFAHLAVDASALLGGRAIKKFRLTKEAKEAYNVKTKPEAKIAILEEKKNEAFKAYDKKASRLHLKNKELDQIVNDKRLKKALDNVEANPSIASFAKTVSNRLNLFGEGRTTIKDVTDVAKSLNQDITHANLGKNIGLLNLKNTLNQRISRRIFKNRPALEKLFKEANDLNVWVEDTKRLQKSFSKVDPEKNVILDAISRATGTKYLGEKIKKAGQSRIISKKISQRVKNNPFINSDINKVLTDAIENPDQFVTSFKKFNNLIDNIAKGAEIETSKKNRKERFRVKI